MALQLERAGHRVVAIDPEAPPGAIFRRVTLEEFAEPGPFDAVVASRSLHHIPDLAGALDRIALLLPQEGTVIVNEHAWDRLDEQTARWALDHWPEGHDHAPRSLPDFLAWWRAEHAGLHGYEAIRAELERRFVEREFAWAPYLYGDLHGAVEPIEEWRLIEAGAIRATGFRYVGVRGRPAPDD